MPINVELPITRQLAAILERRHAEAEDYPADVRDWVFPSRTAATGHVQDPHHLYARIGKAGGAKFWFHGLRNSFITVAERELMLPPLADQAAGQPCPAQRCHRGLCGRLDHRPASRAGSEDRRPDRGLDPRAASSLASARGNSAEVVGPLEPYAAVAMFTGAFGAHYPARSPACAGRSTKRGRVGARFIPRRGSRAHTRAACTS